MIKFLTRFLAWLRPDGVLHLTVSAALYLAIAPFFSVRWSWLPALIVLAIGLGKEIYDESRPDNRGDWHDLECDFLGVISGVLLWYWQLLVFLHF